MKQFKVESAGAVLAVRQSRDDGEPLLLLHGGPGVPDSMQAATAPVLPRFRCISFDQRGTGASACRDGRYDLAAYLDDIEAIRTRTGVAAWHVLGHSCGGLLAQAYVSACPHRVSSLALVSSSLGVGSQWKRTKRESFRIEHARAGLRGTLRFYAGTGGSRAAIRSPWTLCPAPSMPDDRRVTRCPRAGPVLTSQTCVVSRGR